jgi:excisionase family DNA binding protein
MTTTGNTGLDALADAIANRVFERIQAAQESDENRLMSVSEAAKYLGRTQSAVRHMIAKKMLPAVRRDGRVYLDRPDLKTWVEMGKG